MKKTISVMLIITMLMSLLCLNSFAASTSLVAAPSTANKGDTVTISVNVSSGISGAQLLLEYDTKYFRLVDDSVSLSPNFSTGYVNDKTPGRLKAAVVALDEQPACTVFSVKFKVLKTGGKMTLKVTEAIDGNNNDITSTVTGTVLTIAEGTGTVTEETIAPQPQTTAAANVTKPASGKKTSTTKKIEGITGTAKAPAPDETLPADIMPTEPTTADSASEQTEKSNTATIIIAVAATLLVLAAAIIIALVIKKKKQQDEPETPNETNENIDKDK